MRRFALLLLFAACPMVAHAQPAVEAVKHKDRIEFKVAGKTITNYWFDGYAKPIFWPLMSPNGASLTRAWPMKKGEPSETTDHPHQKSAWFTHGDLIPKGIELTQKIKGVDGVDFWSENKGHGDIVCVSVSEPKQDGKRISVTTKNEWRTADGKKIMDETRIVTFIDLGGAYLIVVESDLFGSVTEIVFGDTKEGSFGIRINDVLAGKNGKGKLQNADGKVGEKELWGLVSDWCDYSGPIEGKVAGLAILADPKNPHPTAWHARGYGLMAANPFGRAKSGFPAMKGRTDLVTLPKGEHLYFRYGMLLHEGDAEKGRVAEHFQTFVGRK
jgi:hypothetical protein